MKTSSIVILIALALFVTVLGINLSSNASTYADFPTAKASGETVHVVGSWVQRDQTHYDNATDMFQFYMQDTTNNVELVYYQDPKPQNFEQAEKVVVVGGYKDKAFVADKIIMKCPSKFEQTDITAGEKNL